METKKEYMSPELTIVAFMVEYGYALSSPEKRISLLNLYEDMESSGEVENWCYDNEDQTFGNDNISWF